MFKKGSWKAVLNSLVMICCLAFIFSPLFALEKAPNNKKAVMIIAQNNFQDDEFLRPKEVLEKNGVSVTVASTTLNEVTGMLGAKVKPDILLSELNIRDFDAVIFIGGSGATQYLDDALAHKIANDAISADKVVGAICIAPAILANAGVLKGKRATVYSTESESLKAGGSDYTAKPVEKDGKIITASGPAAAVEFGETLVKELLTN
jgi:protease I